MNRFSRLVCTAAACLAGASSFAQQNGLFEETMFRSGKINVVVAVVAVILAGLFAWLFAMDRKVRAMEEKMKDGK